VDHSKYSQEIDLIFTSYLPLT